MATQVQLCAAAVVALQCTTDADVDRTLSTGMGRIALERALNIEAVDFLVQPVVRLFIDRKWRGRVNLTEWGGGWMGAIKLVTLYLAQLPLVLIVSTWPPIENTFKKSPYYVLGAPISKFVITLTSDLTFASLLTFPSREDLNSSSGLLTIWAFASLLWECRQLFKEGSISAYTSGDRFNRIELPAAVLTLTTLFCMRWDIDANGVDQPFQRHTRTFRAMAVLLMWLKRAQHRPPRHHNRQPMIPCSSRAPPVRLPCTSVTSPCLAYFQCFGSSCSRRSAARSSCSSSA
jgi:hypothetical protein